MACFISELAACTCRHGLKDWLTPSVLTTDLPVSLAATDVPRGRPVKALAHAKEIIFTPEAPQSPTYSQAV
jgi:hypothetical protein